MWTAVLTVMQSILQLWRQPHGGTKGKKSRDHQSKDSSFGDQKAYKISCDSFQSRPKWWINRPYHPQSHMQNLEICNEIPN